MLKAQPLSLNTVESVKAVVPILALPSIPAHNILLAHACRCGSSFAERVCPKGAILGQARGSICTGLKV